MFLDKGSDMETTFLAKKNGEKVFFRIYYGQIVLTLKPDYEFAGQL